MSQDRETLIQNAKIFWSGFYRCPTTGRILEGMPGDNKVLCSCRHSNPRAPQERAEQTGVHIIAFLTPATAEEYVDQGIKQRAAQRVDIRRDDHEPVSSNQVERDNPTPAAVKEEIDRNYHEEIYGQDDYDPNNDPWP